MKNNKIKFNTFKFYRSIFFYFLAADWLKIYNSSELNVDLNVGIQINLKMVLL